MVLDILFLFLSIVSESITGSQIKVLLHAAKVLSLLDSLMSLFYLQRNIPAHLLQFCPPSNLHHRNNYRLLQWLFYTEIFEKKTCARLLYLTRVILIILCKYNLSSKESKFYLLIKYLENNCKDGKAPEDKDQMEWYRQVLGGFRLVIAIIFVGSHFGEL